MNRGLKFLACVALGLLAVFVVGFITMQLWNWLIPVLFAGPAITFWQAIGLLLLSKMLFWGFGGKRGSAPCGTSPGGHFRDKFYSKYASMTPEERAVLKKKMQDKWCNWDDSTSGKESVSSND